MIEVTIGGKQYPIEFGMQAISATCKELGLPSMGFQGLLEKLDGGEALDTCQVLLTNALKATARKYKQPFNVADDDLWLLFDDPKFVLVQMPELLTAFFESFNVGPQAQELLSEPEPKKKEEVPA